MNKSNSARFKEMRININKRGSTAKKLIYTY
jgi:hypothetical protein